MSISPNFVQFPCYLKSIFLQSVVQVKPRCCAGCAKTSASLFHVPSAQTHSHLTLSQNSTILRRNPEAQNIDIFVICFTCFWLWKGPCISYKCLKKKINPLILRKKKVLIQLVNIEQERDGDFPCKTVSYLPKTKPELNFLLKSQTVKVGSQIQSLKCEEKGFQ